MITIHYTVIWSFSSIAIKDTDLFCRIKLVKNYKNACQIFKSAEDPSKWFFFCQLKESQSMQGFSNAQSPKWN